MPDRVTPAEPAAIIKVSCNLPVKVWEALSRLAEEEGIAKTEALRQAITTEVYLRNARRDGTCVLLEHPDGTMERLVFKY